MEEYENMEEYEDRYRVYYFDNKLNYLYEDVIATSKLSARNQVKSMKGLNVKVTTDIINLSKSGLTDERLKKLKNEQEIILGKLR